MGRDSRNASRGCVTLEQLPDHLLAEADGLRLTATVHRPEYITISDAGDGCPRILRNLHPGWHRDGAHTAMLSDEVHNAPPAIALLDVAHCERSHLGTPQPAAQEHRQDRAVAQPLGSGDIRHVEQLLGLLDGRTHTGDGPAPAIRLNAPATDGFALGG
jgi:hypothetical protein